MSNSEAPKFELPADLLSYLPQEVLADLINEVEDYVGSMSSFAIERTLQANFGVGMGSAIFADVYGTADVSSAEQARRCGKSRAAVSKAAVRIRRGLGLPVRCPRNARPGRTPASALKTDSVKSFRG